MNDIETIAMVVRIARVAHEVQRRVFTDHGHLAWEECAHEYQKGVIQRVEQRLAGNGQFVSSDSPAVFRLFAAIVDAMKPGEGEVFQITALHLPATV